MSWAGLRGAVPIVLATYPMAAGIPAGQDVFNLDLDLFVVDLPDPRGRPGPRIRDLTLPPGAMLTLVTRGDEVVAPTGHTRLLGWDQVTVLAHARDEADVRAALLEPFDRPAAPEEPEPAPIEAAPPEALEVGADTPLRDHVVLLGHGDVGSVLTRFLRMREIPFVVSRTSPP